MHARRVHVVHYTRLKGGTRGCVPAIAGIVNEAVRRLVLRISAAAVLTSSAS